METFTVFFETVADTVDLVGHFEIRDEKTELIGFRTEQGEGFDNLVIDFVGIVLEIFDMETRRFIQIMRIGFEGMESLFAREDNLGEKRRDHPANLDEFVFIAW